MHPVTLGALSILLVNDLVFKALWPGAWIPGKLSDFAWMTFAPPLLAYILSFATPRSAPWQSTAFAAAYLGLPLLYAAFNTFPSVHDAVLGIIGVFGGDGPRSPLDPTDSLVIPFAMAAALWIWHRPPLGMEGLRARFAVLMASVAALASIASSYSTDWGITDVGRTGSGALGAKTSGNLNRSVYESMDGGLTWTVQEEPAPLQEEEDEAESFWGLRAEGPAGVFYAMDGLVTMETPSGERELYSYEYLQSGGNQWMQALDKRDIENRVIATRVHDLFYDAESGNLIVAMGLQGVVVIAPDGTATRAAVGRYSPTDFSFGNKLRTYITSMMRSANAVYIWVSLLLTFSFAALALTVSKASVGPRCCFALAVLISSILALFHGVYPYEPGRPWDGGGVPAGNILIFLTGYGLIPLLLTIGGLVWARPARRQVLATVAASIAMLPLIGVGALVLFEAGERDATAVAVGLVGSVAFGLWVYQRRMQRGAPSA